MKKRLILLTGIGIGFVLGSYSGRAAYEKLRDTADEIRTNPQVRSQVAQAGETLKEKAPEAAAGIQEAASTAVAAGREKVEELKEKVEEKASTVASDAADAAESDAAAPAKSDSPRADVVSDPETPMEDEGPALRS